MCALTQEEEEEEAPRSLIESVQVATQQPLVKGLLLTGAGVLGITFAISLYKAHAAPLRPPRALPRLRAPHRRRCPSARSGRPLGQPPGPHPSPFPALRPHPAWPLGRGPLSRTVAPAQVWVIYNSSRSRRRRTVDKNLVVVDALHTFLPGAKPRTSLNPQPLTLKPKP